MNVGDQYRFSIDSTLLCFLGSASKLFKLSPQKSLEIIYAEEAVTGGVRNFTKYTGKYLCQSLFFNKVASWGLQRY